MLRLQKTCSEVPVVTIPKPPNRNTPISCENGSYLHVPPLPTVKRSLLPLPLPKNLGDTVRIYHCKPYTVKVVLYAFIVGVAFSCRNIYLFLEINLQVQLLLKRYQYLLSFIVHVRWFSFDTT